MKTKTPDLTAVFCPSCGNGYSGNYCSACGEKRKHAHDLSMKHFIEETIEGFTHFDNRFFRTIRLLFTRPGLLSLHFEEGRRVPYLKPVQLFVICNLLFLIIFSGHHAFSISVDSYLSGENYRNLGLKEAFMAKFSLNDLHEKIKPVFNERLRQQSKVFVFSFIPVLAVITYVLSKRRKTFYTLHLVFASHFLSFFLLMSSFLSLFIDALFYMLSINRKSLDSTYALVFISISIIYLLFSAKKYFNQGWIKAMVTSVAVMIGFLTFLHVYRVALFYKVLQSFH